MRSAKQKQCTREQSQKRWAKTAAKRRPHYERETLEEFKSRTGKDITVLEPVSREPDAVVERAQREMRAESKGVVK